MLTPLAGISRLGVLSLSPGCYHAQAAARACADNAPVKTAVTHGSQAPAFVLPLLAARMHKAHRLQVQESAFSNCLRGHCFFSEAYQETQCCPAFRGRTM